MAMPEGARRFVVIGATNPARRTCASLTARGHDVRHLTEPGDVSIQGVGVTPDIELDPMTVDGADVVRGTLRGVRIVRESQGGAASAPPVAPSPARPGSY